jgi:hypothetical protein
MIMDALLSSVRRALRWLNASELVERRPPLRRVQHYLVIGLSCVGSVTVLSSAAKDWLGALIFLPGFILLPRIEAMVHELFHPTR